MFLQKHPGARLHKSVTTRPPRSDNDTSHTFVSNEEFDTLEHEGKLLLPVEAYGFRYALPVLPTKTQDIVFVLLREQFIDIFKTGYPAAKVIQVEANPAALAQRLAERGDTSRIDLNVITNEIANGRKKADTIISTDQPLEIAFSEFERHSATI